MSGTVEFYGEQFKVADTPNEFALMEFAETGENVEENTMPAMAAMFRLLKEGIDPDDWPRFRAHARKNRADSDALMPVIFAVFEQAAERPTGQPTVSTDGLEITPLRSVSGLDDRAMDRFAGRPDMQAAVLLARRAQASA